MGGRTNLILVGIDSLRADHMGLYGPQPFASSREAYETLHIGDRAAAERARALTRR